MSCWNNMTLTLLPFQMLHALGFRWVKTKIFRCVFFFMFFKPFIFILLSSNVLTICLFMYQKAQFGYSKKKCNCTKAWYGQCLNMSDTHGSIVSTGYRKKRLDSFQNIFIDCEQMFTNMQPILGTGLLTADYGCVIFFPFHVIKGTLKSYCCNIHTPRLSYSTSLCPYRSWICQWCYNFKAISLPNENVINIL